MMHQDENQPSGRYSSSSSPSILFLSYSSFIICPSIRFFWFFFVSDSAPPCVPSPAEPPHSSSVLWYIWLSSSSCHSSYSALFCYIPFPPAPAFRNVCLFVSWIVYRGPYCVRLFWDSPCRVALFRWFLSFASGSFRARSVCINVSFLFVFPSIGLFTWVLSLLSFFTLSTFITLDSYSFPFLVLFLDGFCFASYRSGLPFGLFSFLSLCVPYMKYSCDFIHFFSFCISCSLIFVFCHTVCCIIACFVVCWSLLLRISPPLSLSLIIVACFISFFTALTMPRSALCLPSACARRLMSSLFLPSLLLLSYSIHYLAHVRLRCFYYFLLRSAVAFYFLKHNILIVCFHATLLIERKITIWFSETNKEISDGVSNDWHDTFCG